VGRTLRSGLVEAAAGLEAAVYTLLIVNYIEWLFWE